MKNNDRHAVIKAVLLSGSLPDPQLQQFLDSLTKRALRRVLGLPGCSYWPGQGYWDTWAVQFLHSKDKGSLCLVKVTEQIIAMTTKEAQQAAWNLDAPCADAPIWAAVEATRTAKEAQRSSRIVAAYDAELIWAAAGDAAEAAQTGNSRRKNPLRYHALLATQSAIRTASCVAVALRGYSSCVAVAIESEAEREQEQQCQDLLSLINPMEV